MNPTRPSKKRKLLDLSALSQALEGQPQPAASARNFRLVLDHAHGSRDTVRMTSKETDSQSSSSGMPRADAIRTATAPLPSDFSL